MAGSDLEKAFLEAAEIAKKLPENLQEAGFNRAVEQLLGTGQGGNTGHRKSGGAKKRATRKADEGERDDVSALIDAIDRTAHPDVGATTRVADRALKVLQLADLDHGVDGMTAGEIASVLSRKFRLATKANSVLKALERETDTVDIRGGAGASRVFHIMAPGDAYLERLRAGEEGGRRRATGSAGSTKSSARKAGSRKAGAKKKSTKKKAGKKKSDGKNTSRRPGPKAAIGQLIQAGFCDTARTISEIQEELQHRRGHGFSIQELSPALVRSVRDQSLTRERSDAGQYEYSKA